jgi:hypothetical protein
MDPDTGPDSLLVTSENLPTQSTMDIDSELHLQSSPDLLQANEDNSLNLTHKRRNSSRNQLFQSCYQKKNSFAIVLDSH